MSSFYIDFPKSKVTSYFESIGFAQVYYQPHTPMGGGGNTIGKVIYDGNDHIVHITNNAGEAYSEWNLEKLENECVIEIDINDKALRFKNKNYTIEFVPKTLDQIKKYYKSEFGVNWLKTGR